MEMLKQKKYLGIAGAALTIVGLFLPLINMPSSVSSYAGGVANSFISSGTGIVLLILSLITLLIIFSDKLADKVPFFEKLQNQKLTLIPVGICAIIVIANIMNASSIMALGSMFGISYGIGVWTVGIGIVLSIIYPFLYKGE